MKFLRNKKLIAVVLIALCLILTLPFISNTGKKQTTSTTTTTTASTSYNSGYLAGKGDYDKLQSKYDEDMELARSNYDALMDDYSEALVIVRDYQNQSLRIQSLEKDNADLINRNIELSNELAEDYDYSQAVTLNFYVDSIPYYCCKVFPGNKLLVLPPEPHKDGEAFGGWNIDFDTYIFNEDTDIFNCAWSTISDVSNPTITFSEVTIDERTYRFEVGMTWSDWCSSSYNSLGLYIGVNGVHEGAVCLDYDNVTDVLRYDTSSDSAIPCNYSDVISSDITYYLNRSGAGD